MDDLPDNLGVLPFGNRIVRVIQKDKSSKRVFIIGVYGSTIKANFISKKLKTKIRFLPVDNEPEPFWSGNNQDAQTIISKIKIPKDLGELNVEPGNSNGMLGRTLDKYYLSPLKLKREDVWLCNLIPHLIVNKKERKALKNYNKYHTELDLPKAEIPVKSDKWNFFTRKRRREVIEEIFKSRAEIIVTLGQQPLKWFINEFKPNAYKLLNAEDYGMIKDFNLEAVKLKLVPLFHPKQILKHWDSKSNIGLIHYDWMKNKAKTLLKK